MMQNNSSQQLPPPRYRLTRLGEQMARLPIDPNIGDRVRAVDSRPARAAAGSGGTLGIAAADLLSAIGMRCG